MTSVLELTNVSAMSKHQLSMLNQAIQYIEQNLCESISVIDVCDLFPVSRWEFQRWFRAHVGDSIGSYTRSRRLTEAMLELKRSPDRKILDIAIQYQFGSQEAFTRAFKVYFSIAPGQARSADNRFDRLLKPRATESLLKHLQVGIQREPDIKELGPFRFIGLQVEISSFLQDKEYVEKAPAHWRMFTKRLNELQQRKSENRYGVAFSEGGQMLESRLQYLAALDCLDTAPVPTGMIEALFEKRLYAIFENVGLADRSQDTIDYVYGFWLPNSGYRRAEGSDFEIFDDRYSLSNPQSVSSYCLPIERLAT